MFAASILFISVYQFTLSQHLKHVDADLIRIIIKIGADDTQAIRCQYPAMQPVGLVLLIFLIYLI
ncbi:hypothetical protein BXO88_14860 [Oribacterium sp. C9]|nr:hypothetical protein BXO88_14860 [Oribacterium sp. C9]